MLKIHLKARLGCFGALLLFSLNTQSQELWSLEKVVQETLEKNPKKKQADELVNERNSEVNKARSVYFPVVGAQLDAKTLKDPANASSPRFGATPFNAYSFELAARQPLFRIGLFDGISAPQKDREIAELDAKITERNLIAVTIRAFYFLLLSQRTVENLQNIQVIEKESLATALQRQRSGRGQLLDVLQVKTQLALLAPKIAKAVNDASLASASLANLMGNPGLRQIRINGKLDMARLWDITNNLDFKNADLPELKRVLARQEKIEAQRGVALGQSYPTLDFVGAWGRSTTRKADLFDSYSTKWSYGLELKIPLFSGLSSLAERRDYASQLAQIHFERQSFENEISLNQVKSSQKLKLAQESVASANEAFQLATSALNEAKRNFRYATIDFLQFLSVQESYLEAATALDQTKFNYVDSLTQYFIDSGQDLKKLTEVLGKQG